MTPQQLQIVALSEYLEKQYVTLGWAGTPHTDTFHLALKATNPVIDSMGADCTWSRSNPAVLSLVSRSIVTDRSSKYQEVALQGPLVECFLAELQNLANIKMAAEILEEQQRALVQEAQTRIQSMMQRALTRKIAP